VCSDLLCSGPVLRAELLCSGIVLPELCRSELLCPGVLQLS